MHVLAKIYGENNHQNSTNCIFFLVTFSICAINFSYWFLINLFCACCARNARSTSPMRISMLYSEVCDPFICYQFIIDSTQYFMLPWDWRYLRYFDYISIVAYLSIIYESFILAYAKFFYISTILINISWCLPLILYFIQLISFSKFCSLFKALII